jgi:hypothetical protein
MRQGAAAPPGWLGNEEMDPAREQRRRTQHELCKKKGGLEKKKKKIMYSLTPLRYGIPTSLGFTLLLHFIGTKTEGETPQTKTTRE